MFETSRVKTDKVTDKHTNAAETPLMRIRSAWIVILAQWR